MKKFEHARGFALLEVILFLAVAIVAVGIAAPMLGGGGRRDSIDAAKQQMDVIQKAVCNYFEDVELFPASVSDLVTNPGSVSNWLGPYAQKGFADFEAANLGWNRDPWRNAYQLIQVSSVQYKIRSYGPNRTNESGGGDDIDVQVNSDPILWEITKRELVEINRAILRYNQVDAPPNLSQQYTACLNRLQAKNYLPQGAPPKFDYRYDAWGQWYLTIGNPTNSARTTGPP